MSTYDSVVILGYRPRDPKTWKFPSHIYKSLDRAAVLYNQKVTKYITLSGKWTINFDVLGITQPFQECDAMADYLLAKGVPAKAILRESESKDSISNIYYLKQQIFIPNGMKRLHFIAATARLGRIEFLCKRILGPDYRITTEGVDYLADDVSQNESRTKKKQGDFLAPMRDGDDHWLDGKFFDDPFYKAVKERVKERAALEPFIELASPPWLF